MKVSVLRERIQLLYEHEEIDEDGDQRIVWKRGEWVWAAITPCPPTFYGEKLYSNRYEVAMRKNYNRYTRHALIRRLIWKHKILDIMSPWQEKCGKNLVSAIAMERKAQVHHD